ncbi:aspartate aminotransferase/aminotransferase [Micromonospora sp. Llam0]|uniref:pyridoxal phosphate-dependent aminotransferase n=1 Tax=Micromonospora sp. Llam0 TaxID=2485143 RepID=UPI000F49D4D1|nr:aminotransferase class I/II-fold pyridoxal phosphate-dependent enzyme [Micromonospora sp. Llam0]ROO58732.1 aspartate aminotransferase/aminotransferase [Micromonospora sp. Llam0]
MTPPLAATSSLTRPADRLAAIVPSRIRVVFDLAAELEARGHRVIHLEMGRPDFDTPQVVKDAAGAALAAGRVHYGPNAGSWQLRAAVAATLAACGGPRYDPGSEILVTIGASEAVFLAVMAFCDPGDEVIVPVPAWPAYEACVRLAGATPVFLPLDPDDDHVLDPARVRRLLTPRTRMVVACTPHNPTGAVVDPGRLAHLAGILRGSRVLVLADEIYRELVYDGTRHVPVATVADLAERTITVGGFAKAYAMDGWRLGWLAGPAPLVAPALRVRQFTTTCPPTFLQDAAIVALRDTATEREQMRRAFAARRAAALELLGRQRILRVGRPSGAFYLYLTYPEQLGPADDFTLRLLEDEHVAVVPGIAFDPTGRGRHAIRVSYAASMDDVQEGIRRLIDYATARADGA